VTVSNISNAKKKPPIKPKPIEAPRHLSKKTREWWELIVREYSFEEHEFYKLTAAAEAWDRKEEARKTLKKEGLIYVDRFGQPCSRPEVGIERDARLAFLRAIRELNLGNESPDSRPPALKYK
jgi:phage terminase small subunit